MTRMMGEIAIAISGSLALSLIVKATIVCGGTLMALCIAKRSRAAVRHVLLSTAFLVLLALPLASLTVPPRDVSLPIHSSDSTVLPVTLPLPDGIPLPSAESGDSAPTIAARTAPSALTVLFAAWMAGVTYFLATMSLGLRRARRARRNGSPWPEGQAAVSSVAAAPQLRRRIQLLLNDAVTGPVTCGVLRPAIVLPPDARGWPPEDLRRALVHELEHVRRGDWLVLCLARIVCAFYWFHPLVWMSLRQLRLEAERACDDAVLRTADAEEYADQLLTLAERVVAGRTPAVLAMASRGELAARVSAVLDEYQSRGAAGSRWIAAASGAALFVLVGIVPLRAVVGTPKVVSQPGIAHAETASPSEFVPTTVNAPRPRPVVPEVPVPTVNAIPQQSAPVTSPAPRFEVASIRPNRSGDISRRIEVAANTFTATNITVRLLIEDAYRHASGRMRREYELVGGPAWINSEGFDVIAKASAAPSDADLRQMLQSLLIERFSLKVHPETRELPAYALIRARADGQLGPQLKPSNGECRRFGGRGAAPQPDGLDPAARPCGFAGRGGPGTISGVAVTMAQVATVLANQVDGEVVDQTKLPGIFDLTLQFMPLRRLPIASPALADAPSIFTAVQEQIGLKLESRRLPMEVLVLDSVDRPTEN